VFASWLGWTVDADRALVFVIDPHQDHTDLVRQCLRIGYERFAGYLDRGVATWQGSGRATSSIEIVDADTRLGTTLDVRQAHEFAAGHVPGASHVELGALIDTNLPEGPITVMCGHHERAMTGASILERRGRSEVTVLWDGFGGWRDAGHPIETTS
jgi:rhodanese-related sulfurtransferase